MFKSKTILSLAIAVLLVCTLSTTEGNQKPANKKEMVRLRAIQTSTGPQLEVKVGDFVCTASELSVCRKQGKVWTVKPVNGKVQMQSGESIRSAGQLEIALRF